ncbi:MAG: hypothetical protein AVDCRST_MAG14-1037, partial [uncultured Rubrobacteraceae bacterium]
GRVSFERRGGADTGGAWGDEHADVPELRLDPGLGPRPHSGAGRGYREALLRLAQEHYRAVAVGARGALRGARGTGPGV